jgi:ribonuclease P protein component
MLHKLNRLAKTKDVKGALSRGRPFFSPYYTIRYAKVNGVGKRFTVIVSTKVSKKATVRNRLKRLIREYIRLRLSSFKPGDYAIMVKPSAAKLPPKLLVEEFANVTKKV